MDDISIKTYYICNGKGKCHNSETCSFNTGDPDHCNLTSDSSLANNDEAVFLVHRLSMALSEAQRVFDIQCNIVLTEKENKNVKRI